MTDGSVVVRVIPDSTGLPRTFDYLVPPSLVGRVQIGTRVRVPLGPRRVGGWVIDVGVQPPAGIEPRPIAKVSGHGPDASLIALADWARWRWAARTSVPFLRAASPPRNVDHLPAPGAGRLVREPADAVEPAIADALAGGCRVLRLPPVARRLPVAVAAARLGPTLVLCATAEDARNAAAGLRRAGVDVAMHPADWAAAAAGGRTVVGTRSAAWARMPDLRAIVVFDEHDESLQSEEAPTWHARDVAAERARRAGIPCVLVTPAPTAEGMALSERLCTTARADERAGWPRAVIVDRREEDRGRNALFSPALSSIVRSGASVLCVLNRKGRAALLACRRCGELARCEGCDGAMRADDDQLLCRRCGQGRPPICLNCGGVDIVTRRMGVTRVAEDLAALADEPVREITGTTSGQRSARHDRVDGHVRLTVGTEAALHHLASVDVVAFLEFDQELLAPRFRAAEEALALVVRAARLVGGRSAEGRILIQTRQPEHEVCRAVVAGDPDLVLAAEQTRRRDFAWPPCGAVAELRHEAAEAYADALRRHTEIRVLGPQDGSWLVRADELDTLCNALASEPRPPGRLRVAVNPARL